jgi:hypothetical protein
VSKKECPQYYARIEHPMDLSKMLQKAEDGVYEGGSGGGGAKGSGTSVWEG